MKLSPHALMHRLVHRETPHDAPPRPPRLLVVDDEVGIRALLMRMLAPIECDVLVAVDGPDAIQLFERAGPIDLMMPSMNGLELGRRLQQSMPDLPVLYLTGFSDALFEERPVLGANEAFVEKPISPALLYEALSLSLYGRLGGMRRRVEATVAQAPGLVQQTAWL